MEYKHGEPISNLLSEYLMRYTSEEDVAAVRKHNNCGRSLSTILQIRRGAIPINQETQRYIDDLFEIAVKKQSLERLKFEPLLKSKKVKA